MLNYPEKEEATMTLKTGRYSINFHQMLPICTIGLRLVPSPTTCAQAVKFGYIVEFLGSAVDFTCVQVLNEYYFPYL